MATKKLQGRHRSRMFLDFKKGTVSSGVPRKRTEGNTSCEEKEGRGGKSGPKGAQGRGALEGMDQKKVQRLGGL